MSDNVTSVHVLGRHFELPEAWTLAKCPTCGGTQALKVAVAARTVWLRCVTCLQPTVQYGGAQYPAAMPLRDVEGLPPTDQAIWAEVRTCLGAGANAAAVMLCRKLLFHVAVAHGLPAKNDRDRAPGFAEAVNHLEAEGVVTKRMRPWVDRIKDVGNEANHELEPVDAAVALDVGQFTVQLLHLAYELDSMMGTSADADH